MHATSILTAAAALMLGIVQASPLVENRQDGFGCKFYGDGIKNQHVGVGHDIDVLGDSGHLRHLDCGTTSNQFVPGIFAKCTVDGKQVRMTEIEGDKLNIKCSFGKKNDDDDDN
ncbi:unnamed protein product [Discula destructiva]